MCSWFHHLGRFSILIVSNILQYAGLVLKSSPHDLMFLAFRTLASSWFWHLLARSKKTPIKISESTFLLSIQIILDFFILFLIRQPAILWFRKFFWEIQTFLSLLVRLFFYSCHHRLYCDQRFWSQNLDCQVSLFQLRSRKYKQLRLVWMFSLINLEKKGF